MREKIYRMALLWLLLFLLCPGKVSAQNRISIDASHKYQGMGASFAKGYEPYIEKNTMILTVPFVSEERMKANQITVGIDFERQENSPFYFKNYQKKVTLSKQGIYLYQCRLKLKKDRINGQYPLYLWVEGKAAQSEEPAFRQEFTIYVEITDGIAPKSGEEENKNEENFYRVEQEAGEDGNVFKEDGSSDAFSEGTSSGQSQNTEGKISQPRLIVRENSLQGQSLEAGSSVFWKLSVQNCSSRHSVENIKVTLSCDSHELVFERTAWYFEKISAGNEMELSQNVTAAKKADTEYVQVQFQIEYQDAEGESYTCTETLNLWLQQPEHARLASLSFPQKVYASDTELLTFQVQNTGLAPVYDAKVLFQGTGLFAQQELFLGTLEGGASLPGELQVFVGTLDMDAQGTLIEGATEKYGDTIGTVVFSYENAQGEVTEQTQEIHTLIEEPQIVELKVEKEVPKTNQWWITIVAGIMLLLILVIIWLYLRLRFYQRMRH